MYNASFDMWFNANNLDIVCSAGVNPNSEDWNKLYQKLNQFGSVDKTHFNDLEVGAGDYSGFDTTHSSTNMRAACYVTYLFYKGKKEENNVRRILEMDLYDSYHVNGQYLYEWNGSLGSGHPATFRINCIINHLNFMHCWYRILPDVDFFSNVYICAGGDDVIYSVANKYKDVFNEITISHLMSEIGYTFTTETKQEVVTKFRPIFEVEFLKRCFRLNRFNKVAAPLRYSVCIEMALWTRKKKSNSQAIENGTNALRELSIWTSLRESDDKERACKDFIKIQEAFQDLYSEYTLPVMYYETSSVVYSRESSTEHYYC